MILGKLVERNAMVLNSTADGKVCGLRLDHRLKKFFALNQRQVCDGVIFIIENIKGCEACRMQLRVQMDLQRIGHHGAPLDQIEIRLSIMDDRQLAIENAAGIYLLVDL